MAETRLTRRTPLVPMWRDPFFGGSERFFGEDLLRPLRLMDRLFGDFATDIAAEGGWCPAVDLAETDDEFVVTAELPGLSKKDVEVSVENDILTLSGERKAETEEQKGRWHRVERSYGEFHRSFRLPGKVDAAKVDAKFKDGLLTVTVPKVEGAKPRKIEIH
jgi:HSP20 family protein